MATPLSRPASTSGTIAPWRSLKTRVTIFTLAIFLVGIWSLTFYSSVTLHNDLEHALGEQQLSAVTIIAAGINTELDDRMRALESFAAGITSAMLGNAAAMQRFLEERGGRIGIDDRPEGNRQTRRRSPGRIDTRRWQPLFRGATGRQWRRRGKGREGDDTMNTEVVIPIAEDDEGHAGLVRKNLARVGIVNELLRFKDGQETPDFLFQKGEGRKRQSGAAYYVAKPTDYERFVNVIRQPGLFLAVVEVPAVNGGG